MAESGHRGAATVVLRIAAAADKTTDAPHASAGVGFGQIVLADFEFPEAVLDATPSKVNDRHRTQRRARAYTSVTVMVVVPGTGSIGRTPVSRRMTSSVGASEIGPGRRSWKEHAEMRGDRYAGLEPISERRREVATRPGDASTAGRAARFDRHSPSAGGSNTARNIELRCRL
jgi:hypothetical protein